MSVMGCCHAPVRHTFDRTAGAYYREGAPDATVRGRAPQAKKTVSLHRSGVAFEGPAAHWQKEQGGADNRKVFLELIAGSCTGLNEKKQAG